MVRQLSCSIIHSDIHAGRLTKWQRNHLARCLIALNGQTRRTQCKVERLAPGWQVCGSSVPYWLSCTANLRSDRLEPLRQRPPKTSKDGCRPDFDREVARVVADLDRIEAETLCQMEHSTLDRRGRFALWGSYCSSISTFRSIRTRHAVSATRRRPDSPGRFSRAARTTSLIGLSILCY
jgi:hypothetical protein